jgi:hypothetical protein
MPLIPPPRPTGLPKEGRYAVGFGRGMGAYLGVGEPSREKGEGAAGEGEVVGLKCELVFVRFHFFGSRLACQGGVKARS